MKFIALDVNVGDAFILINEDNTFIVDGGQNESGILQKLNKVNVAHVDALICTHYDADHLNGIIGILKSTKFHINEIWLPDIFGDIALTISQQEEVFYDLIHQNDNTISPNEKKYLSISNYIDKKKIDYGSIESNSSELFNIEILEHFHGNLQYHSFCFHFFKSYITNRIIKKIIKLIIEAVKSGAHIRWLKYVDKFQKNKIANQFDLFSLNSYETTIIQYDKINLSYSLYCLTQINKESLVFLYDNKNLPNILFSSESDFKFICNSINLRNSSIVTAPHHGSHENNNAYGKINGNGLIYVRCDKSQTIRPCNEFINLPVKYCTICRNITKKKPVILNYNNNSWTTSSNPCIC